MNKEDLSKDQFHELFQSYLLEKFEGAKEDVAVIMEIAEEILPYTLNEYFGTGFVTIYDIKDISEVEQLRKKIKAHNVLKVVDMKAEPRYTEVLKWYRMFLKKMLSNDTPFLTPGEYDARFEDSPSNVSDIVGGINPVVHDDADYAPDTEGVEHQYNLTKKERNPELRRRCIEYYKSLWGGRIHCICCGFDFGKAYGELGEGYIEIHHIEPHHTFEGEHEVDPKTKLIPLCSNCHSMIHRVKGQGECMTLEELKVRYIGKRFKE